MSLLAGTMVAAGFSLPATAGEVIIRSGSLSIFAGSRAAGASIYFGDRDFDDYDGYYDDGYYDDGYRYRRRIRIRDRDIEDSTLINPVIINSDIDDSTLVNPVIIDSRSRRSNRIIVRPSSRIRRYGNTYSRPRPNCFVNASLRAACQ